MKQVSIPLEELIIVLEAMRDTGGTTHVVFTEHDGWPALFDKNEPDNLIMFQGEEDDGAGDLH